MIGNNLQLPTNDFRLFPRWIHSGVMRLCLGDVATEHATVLLAKKFSLQMYRANVHALAITSFTDTVLSKSGNIKKSASNRSPFRLFSWPYVAVFLFYSVVFFFTEDKI